MFFRSGLVFISMKPLSFHFFKKVLFCTAITGGGYVQGSTPQEIRATALGLPTTVQLIGDIWSTNQTAADPLAGGVAPQAGVQQTYTYNFTTTQSGPLQFYFRQDPAFWTLYSTTLTLPGSSANLLTNGSFTGGGIANNGINVPTGWATIGVQGLRAAGTLQGNTWCDGVEGGFDGIAQNILAGQNYNLQLVAHNDSFTNQQATTLLQSGGNITELIILAQALPTGIVVTGSGGGLSVPSTSPTVTITSSSTTLNKGATSTINFNFSEAPSSFTTSDITVTGGTLSNFLGSGTSYTATFTPTDNTSSGSGSIGTIAGFFTDTNSNSILASNLATPITYDTVSPTVAITSSSSTLNKGATSTVSFNFSEAPSSFTASDITVTGGTLGPLTGSGTSYTAIFTPTPNVGTGSASIGIASGSFTDTAGNPITASSSLATPITFDTLCPTVTITSDQTTLQKWQTSTLTFQFSDAPSSFTADDITVTGGTLSNLSGSGTSYTATFTPDDNTNGGSASISTSAGFFRNSDGNSILASTLAAPITYNTMLTPINLFSRLRDASSKITTSTALSTVLAKVLAKAGDSNVNLEKCILANLVYIARQCSQNHTTQNQASSSKTVGSLLEVVQGQMNNEHVEADIDAGASQSFAQLSNAIASLYSNQGKADIISPPRNRNMISKIASMDKEFGPNLGVGMPSTESVLQSLPNQRIKKDLHTFWVQTIGQQSHLKTTSDDDIGVNTQGIAAVSGMDTQATQDLRLGVMMGYSQTNAKIHRGNGQGRTKKIFSGLYGSYKLPKQCSLDFQGSLGQSLYDNERHIDLIVQDYIASEHHKSFDWFGRLQLNKKLLINKWTISPFVAASFSSIQEQGYQETGAGDLNQINGSCINRQLTTEMGVNVAVPFKTFETQETVMMGKVAATRSQAIAAKKERLTYLQGDVDDPFVSLTPKKVNYGLDFLLGVQHKFTKTTSISLAYQGQLQRNSQSNSLRLRFEMKF